MSVSVVTSSSSPVMCAGGDDELAVSVQPSDRQVASRALCQAEELDKLLNEVQPHIKPKEVLVEDDYVEDLEKIITRDYYPELPILEAQGKYIEALDNNDHTAARKLQNQYGKRLKTPKFSRSLGGTAGADVTPSTFETPTPGIQREVDLDAKGGTSYIDGIQDARNLEPEEERLFSAHQRTNLRSLDAYQNKYTSEDNVSFGKILDEHDRDWRRKRDWMFIGEIESNKAAIEAKKVPPFEEQAQASNANRVDTWAYTPLNALMYPGSGHISDPNVEIDKAKLKKRGINRYATRISDDDVGIPVGEERKNTVAAQKAAKLALQGKIGVDGKEVAVAPTPKVNNYGFVATPSPAPGVAESPMMTWGEIEETPEQIEAPPTPKPVFKIPELPKREQIALELNSRIHENARNRKRDTLDKVKAAARVIPTEGAAFGSVRDSPRVDFYSLSPAAQKLAKTGTGKRGILTDDALRASYASPVVERTKDPKASPFYTPSPMFKNQVKEKGGFTPTPDRPRADLPPAKHLVTILNPPKDPKPRLDKPNLEDGGIVRSKAVGDGQPSRPPSSTLLHAQGSIGLSSKQWQKTAENFVRRLTQKKRAKAPKGDVAVTPDTPSAESVTASITSNLLKVPSGLGAWDETVTKRRKKAADFFR